MQQRVDGIERPELTELLLQNALDVLTTQRTDAVFQQGTSVESLPQLFRLWGVNARLRPWPGLVFSPFNPLRL